MRLLDEKGVKYLIVGGYAVGYHGYPRSNGGMDVWTESTEETTEQGGRALKEFDFDVASWRWICYSIRIGTFEWAIHRFGSRF